MLWLSARKGPPVQGGRQTGWDMRKIGAALVLIAMLLAVPAQAATSVVASISLSQQRMTVLVNGIPRYHRLVSTARRGYRTPMGSFRPHRLERIWYSRKYDLSPMPPLVFFRRRYTRSRTTYVNDITA